MRLVYGQEAFEGIVRDVLKHDITEEGIQIQFEPKRKEGIILGDQDQRTLFLNSHIRYALAQVKHFIIDKKKPGMLILSANPHLKKAELMNNILLHHVLPLQNVIFAGQHEYSKPELDFLVKNKLHFFSMKEISQEGLHEVTESIMSIAKRFTDLYILIDSSVLDQSIIPQSRPGGFSTRELTYLLQRLKFVRSLDTIELVIPPAQRDLAVKLITQSYVQSNNLTKR